MPKSHGAFTATPSQGRWCPASALTHGVAEICHEVLLSTMTQTAIRGPFGVLRHTDWPSSKLRPPARQVQPGSALAAKSNEPSATNAAKLTSPARRFRSKLLSGPEPFGAQLAVGVTHAPEDREICMGVTACLPKRAANGSQPDGSGTGFRWYSWVDSNHRPPDPQSPASLSHGVPGRFTQTLSNTKKLGPVKLSLYHPASRRFTQVQPRRCPAVVPMGSRAAT